MGKKSIAREYAGSLFATAGRDKAARIVEEAGFFSAVLEAVPDMEKIFSNPAVSKEAKEKLVGLVGEKAGLDGAFVAFVKMVVAKGRVSIWREIAEALSELSDESQGIVRGKIFSARPLPSGQKERLEAEMAGTLQKKVKLDTEVSPELIGGCEVRIGSLVYDGTVSRALEDIKNSLLKR